MSVGEGKEQRITGQGPSSSHSAACGSFCTWLHRMLTLSVLLPCCLNNGERLKGPGPAWARHAGVCKTQGATRVAGATEGGDSSGLFLLLAEACLLSGSRGLRKRGLGQGLPSPRTPGGRGLVPLTYKQGMYTRLPTITSMNSSGEQSSRKSTSALKISEGLRLRANCVPEPLVPSQMRA